MRATKILLVAIGRVGAKSSGSDPICQTLRCARAIGLKEAPSDEQCANAHFCVQCPDSKLLTKKARGPVSVCSKVWTRLGVTSNAIVIRQAFANVANARDVLWNTIGQARPVDECAHELLDSPVITHELTYIQQSWRDSHVTLNLDMDLPPTDKVPRAKRLKHLAFDNDCSEKGVKAFGSNSTTIGLKNYGLAHFELRDRPGFITNPSLIVTSSTLKKKGILGAIQQTARAAMDLISKALSVRAVRESDAAVLCYRITCTGKHDNRLVLEDPTSSCPRKVMSKNANEAAMAREIENSERFLELDFLSQHDFALRNTENLHSASDEGSLFDQNNLAENESIERKNRKTKSGSAQILEPDMEQFNRLPSLNNRIDLRDDDPASISDFAALSDID